MNSFKKHFKVELENIKKDEEPDGLETENCPMCPNVFFGLCSVRGFNKLNGYTYVDYVSHWRERWGNTVLS